MTQLAALHAKISGDASGFVKATNTAGAAADKLTTKVAGGGAGGVAGATARMSGAFSKLSGSTAMRMLPMQFSQVAQQAAAGGGVMRALTIQAADIGLAFGTVGTIIGILATVAMPTLIAMFSSAEDNAEDLEKALEGFSSALSRVSSATEIAKRPIEELRQEYGRFAEEVKEASRVTARAALGTAMREYRDAAGAAKEMVDGFTTALENHKAAIDKVASSSAMADGPMRGTFKALQDQAEQTRVALDEAAKALGMSVAETNLLVAAMDRMEGAEGPEALAEAASSALGALTQVFDTTKNIPPEVAAIIEHLRTVQLEAAAATADFEDMREAAASVRVGGGVDPLRADEDDQTGGEYDPLKPDTGTSPVGRGRSQEEIEREKTKAKLERLQDEFKNELELEAQHYAQQQELLQTALDAELLTRAEYDSLNEKAKKAHLDKMASIDAYAHGSTMQKTDKFLGDMASALGTGNEKMLEISKKFGAAQALISAWQGAAEALKKPWPLNLTAFAQVLGQGMAAVAAIKGVNAGGTTSGTADGGGDVAAAEPASIAQQRSLTLIGDRFNRQQAVSIAEFMNEGTDDGLVIRGAR